LPQGHYYLRVEPRVAGLPTYTAEVDVKFSAMVTLGTITLLP